jgi:hypothetical protein
MIACEKEGNAAITEEPVTNIRNVRSLLAEQYNVKRYERVLSKLLKKSDAQGCSWRPIL